MSRARQRCTALRRGPPHRARGDIRQRLRRREASVTISLRLSLSSKVTTSGGRLNSIDSQDYDESARDAAPNMFDWRDRSKIGGL
jgi:hypothetical protein